MPSPQFITCAASGSTDEKTGLLSLFGLVESIEVTPDPLGSPPPALKLRVDAVWRRDDSDAVGDLFESEIALIAPNGVELRIFKSTSFLMPNYFHRSSLPSVTLREFPMEGLYRWEARVRKAGAAEWSHRQSYWFLVNIY